MRLLRLLTCWFALALLPNVLRGQSPDLSLLPSSATAPIDFQRDIQPILKICTQCHGPEKPKSKFRLDNREDALKGGAGGVDIIVGDSAKSPLIHNVAGLDPDPDLFMPPPDKGEALTPLQIGLLRAWIDQGLKWPAKPAEHFTFSVSPAVLWTQVRGDENKFRENVWSTEGITGGAETFELREPLGKDAGLIIAGRIVAPDQYRVTLEAKKRDLGFVRVGFNELRKYYDNSGGAALGVTPTVPSNGRELHLDLSRTWVEFGLTIPDWPRFVLGYEHQTREGTKSSLSWEAIGPFTNRAAIYPGAKQIDETTDVIRLGATHDFHGTLFDDQFRAEFYNLKGARNIDAFGQASGPPLAVTSYRETYEHTQIGNSLRIERSLRDWLFVSGGYYYSRITGEADFNSQTVFPPPSVRAPIQGDQLLNMTLKRFSHVWNLNAALGPWDGLSFVAGVQNEWTQQRGFGEALVGFAQATNPGLSDIERKSLEGSLGVRYTRIPYTVLFGEARLQSEHFGQFESSFIDDGFSTQSDFLRDTDAKNETREFKTGFTVSPWRYASLQGSYRHRFRSNRFDHEVDSDQGQPPFAEPGNGYPAFITGRDADTDEWDGRLVLRPNSWLKSTLHYRRTIADYRSTTDPSQIFFPPISEPGGTVLAGDYSADVYSFTQTVNPMRRLYLSATISYEDSRITTGDRAPSIAPYAGDVRNLLSSATWILDERSDLILSYSLSRADYRQDNVTTGLPLGIVYSNQSATAGITRKFSDTVSGKFQYGFYRYREPTAFGANDYTAHTLLASISIDLR